MKTFLLILALFLSCNAHALDLAQVSRAEILATVDHLERITTQAKADATTAQAETKTIQLAANELQNQRDKAVADLEAMKAWGIGQQNARFEAEKERDSMVWIFSVACACAALAALGPIVGQWIKGPIATPLAMVGVFIAGFATGFTIGRWALHFLAQFTPHLPF